MLHASPLIALLEWRALTDEQRARVATAWDDAGFRRRAESARLRRALSVEAPDPAVIAAALASDDAKVQRLLLERQLLDEPGHRHLASHGATRAIRNLAATARRRRG